jgi:hypothetical protein
MTEIPREFICPVTFEIMEDPGTNPLGLWFNL